MTDCEGRAWWNYTDTQKLHFSDKNLPLCHFVHHKFLAGCHGIETGHLQFRYWWIGATVMEYIVHFNACNEANLMHNLSSVYSVTIPLHVSGLLVAHHQEVTMYICDNWYVLYVLVDCRQTWSTKHESPFQVLFCFLSNFKLQSI
jgi:hypothetical protein